VLYYFGNIVLQDNTEVKILATIVLSLIAIVASLILAISTDCAFTAGRQYRVFSVMYAAVSLAVVVVTVWALVRLIRMRDNDDHLSIR